MPFVLTNMGMIQCPHGGVAPLSSLVGSPMHQIDGGNILTMQNIGPVPFVCPFFQAPCLTVTSWVPNQIRMSINGALVLTNASIPITNNGPGTVTFAGQTKVQVL
jgi:hypothetical protein